MLCSVTNEKKQYKNSLLLIEKIKNAFVVKRLLIIQTAFLGDLILTTPLVHEIRKRYPDYLISILVNKGTEAVLDFSPDIDEVIPFDKKKIKSSLWGFFRFIREIRNKNFAICISPHFSYRSSLISFFSGAKFRVGYAESGFSFLHTKRVHRPLRGMHEVDKLYSLLFIPDQFPKHKRPYLYIDSDKTIHIKNIYKQKRIEIKKYIVVAPSSVWETKRMPEDKFIDLVTKIRKQLKIPVILIGSSIDSRLCESIVAGAGDHKIYNMAGVTNLIELSWVIQNARAIVTNDSSPIHFASAHNIPTLAVFGATVPDFGYTPLAEINQIAEIHGLKCRPCGIHGGTHCPEGHFKCMKDQDTDQMVATLRQWMIKNKR